MSSRVKELHARDNAAMVRNDEFEGTTRTGCLAYCSIEVKTRKRSSSLPLNAQVARARLAGLRNSRAGCLERVSRKRRPPH